MKIDLTEKEIKLLSRLLEITLDEGDKSEFSAINKKLSGAILALNLGREIFKGKSPLHFGVHWKEGGKCTVVHDPSLVGMCVEETVHDIPAILLEDVRLELVREIARGDAERLLEAFKSEK